MTVLKSFPARIQVLLFIFGFLFATPNALSLERLVLIGGGPTRPTEALRKFSGWCNPATGPLLLVTWASKIPQEVAIDLRNDFRTVFNGNFSYSLTPPESITDQLDFIFKLNDACGVFFSGGDQDRIMDVFEVLGGHMVFDALHKAYASGKVFGGTSAGTAIMSKTIITASMRKDGTVPTRPGLGFLPDYVIVDQHFTQRERVQRLLTAQKQSRSTLGIGIDEDTAIIVQDRSRIEVVGNHSIRIFTNNPHQLWETKLRSGDSWTFPHVYFLR